MNTIACTSVAPKKTTNRGSETTELIDRVRRRVVRAFRRKR